MRHRWFYLLIIFFYLILFIIVAPKMWEEFTNESRISDLLKNGAYTNGVLVQELAGSPNAVHFKGEYEAGNKKYEFFISDTDKKLSLQDTVAIRYNRRNPGDFIIERDYPNNNLLYTSLGFILYLLFLIFLGTEPLYQFLKIGYLVKNGKRVLCEPIKYKWRVRASIAVICKVPGDDSKLYKGYAYMSFEDRIKGNHIKYIPVYISPNNEKFYYVDCDEALQIIKHGTYNGHTIKELQGS